MEIGLRTYEAVLEDKVVELRQNHIFQAGQVLLTVLLGRIVGQPTVGLEMDGDEDARGIPIKVTVEVHAITGKARTESGGGRADVDFIGDEREA